MEEGDDFLSDHASEPPLEIERKYLLDGLPALPSHAVAERMEQGYLPDAGRLRRTVKADGSLICTFTVKEGNGLVRREWEQRISPGEFERRWPGTRGRRLRKTRHRVTEAGLVWEIDVYDDIDLVVAEVEIPSPGTPVTPPPWLASHVVREVTDEPRYRNFELATRPPDH